MHGDIVGACCVPSEQEVAWVFLQSSFDDGTSQLEGSRWLVDWSMARKKIGMNNHLPSKLHRKINQ